MSTLTITLSDDRLAKLREIADRFNTKAADLAWVSIEELLTRPDESFQQAADYILQKNANSIDVSPSALSNIKWSIGIASPSYRSVWGSFRSSHLAALESSLTQPRMTFGGTELYPSIVDKAAVLGYSLIQNHPFLDGNKRTGHAAMEVFLLLNHCEIQASVDEQERIVLQVHPAKWIEKHLRFGFVTMLRQNAEGRRPTIRFRPIARSDSRALRFV